MSRRATLYDQRPLGPQTSVPVRTRSREYEEVESYLQRPERRSRPDFLSKDYARNDQGPVVLREREAEISSRPLERKPRSVSPLRISTRERVVTRDPSLPAVERIHARVVERERERERERSQPPPDRLLARIVESKERVCEGSPVLTPTHTEKREKVYRRERERERSITPPPPERVHTRKSDTQKSLQVSESSSASSSTPPPILAPPIHQEIITHHRHINHGFEIAEPLTPPPSSRREVTTKDIETDIYSSRHDSDANLNRRETSEAVTLSKAPQSRHRNYYDDTIIYEYDKNRHHGQDIRIELSQRRSRSAHPGRHRETLNVEIRDDEDEADYYARKNDERAVIGEAKNGVTKDWAIIDVPPGTERVRLDGVGGASQEITWQKYSGVRRSKFIPDREHVENRQVSPPPRRENVRQHIEIRDDLDYKTSNLEIEISHNPSRRRDNADIYDRENQRREESSDRRDGLSKQHKPRGGDLWTEITKDLVTREAINEMGYDFEETEYFYYILKYLRYEDVVDLVKLSDQIRYERQQRIKEIEWERRQLEMREMEQEEWEWRERELDEWERKQRRLDRDYNDERIVEREIAFDSGTRRW